MNHRITISLPNTSVTLSGKIPIYINNFNRYRSVVSLVSYLNEVPSAFPIVVDNNSTYQPLIDWYDSAPCAVVRLDQNHGSKAPWSTGTVMPRASHLAYFHTDYYVVTDSDLDLNQCPKDLLDRLVVALDRYPNVIKAGLSLAIDDLPLDAPCTESIRSWEQRFWSEAMDKTIYRAEVDTTFALYRVGDMHARVMHTSPAVRLAPPYTARHLPWYLTPSTVTEEDAYYLRSIRGEETHWSNILKGALAQ